MKRSWLIQRLRKPIGDSVFGPDNPFAFGGGLRNGGLNDEAMGLLRKIFSFDYMGSAEFEFGAVPEALQGLARADLVADAFTVDLADVAPDWRERSDPAPHGTADIFVLCRRDDFGEVETRIRSWAAEGYAAKLKEATMLSSTLRPHNEWDGETVGWLELDNGFFFFTDREMWVATALLFGVVVETAEAAS